MWPSGYVSGKKMVKSGATAEGGRVILPRLMHRDCSKIGKEEKRERGDKRTLEFKAL